MNSYSEVRRVRAAMSAAAGHDVRRLIEAINKRRPQSSARIIDPGTEAETAEADQNGHSVTPGTTSSGAAPAA